MPYQIEPIEQITRLEYKYIEVSVSEINLGVSATIITVFMDATGVAYKREVATLEGEDYYAWGTDDDYILEWVVKKYNLTLIPENRNI